MTTIEPDARLAALSLLSADAVRRRCSRFLAEADALQHFAVHLDRLDATADYVIDVIRSNYPDLEIPFHSRWRHFSFAGVDRWRELARELPLGSPERARIQFDLVVTSVLLDAGAGPYWKFRDARSGLDFARSEGLALASLEAFGAGLFSSDPDRPLQADARGLSRLDGEALARAFQVCEDNPLEGLAGRTALMNALGAVLDERADYFPGDTPRVGNLFDWICMRHGAGIAAPELLSVVLDALGGVWSGRANVAGVSLGDTWRHSLIATGDATTGLVPFHKLSQWLTYSLIEPLQDAGVNVTDIDGLTGLAEYRNGGLFIDLGVLELRDPDAALRPHAPADSIIVEWRAMTVALLDRVAVIIREKLGRTSDNLPLASLLEGGTWAAGRKIAAHMRDDGSPPLRIVSDGSVF